MEKEFDYYIFVDYSEELIGYAIINKNNLLNCLSKTPKLKHYHDLKRRKLYLKTMKKLFLREKILECLEKHRISELRHNVELCSEILSFCKKNSESNIFISVDDRQYKGFMKLMKIIDEKRFTIVKEGELKKNSKEYKLSLIIDNLLNLKRTREYE